MNSSRRKSHRKRQKQATTAAGRGTRSHRARSRIDIEHHRQLAGETSSLMAASTPALPDATAP